MRRKAIGILLIIMLLSPLGGRVAQANSAVAEHATGEQSVLILPVEFTDVRNSVSIQHIKSLSVLSNDYIREASYNQTWLNSTVAQSWTVLNGTFNQYSYSSELQGCPKLAHDSLAYFQKQYAISAFGTVVIIHAKDDFWQMRPEQIFGQTCSTGNIQVKSVVIISEADNYLSLTHELMHSIGGSFEGPTGALVPRVQDLYNEQAVQAHAINNFYVFSWDLMSDEQNGLTAWTKLKLGWIQPSQVVTLDSWSNTVVNISAMEIPGGTKVVQIPIDYTRVSFQNGTTVDAWSYYLVEYRDTTGIDKNITSSVLITLGNNTRFYDRLPGPLTEVSQLTVGNTVWIELTQANLTIVSFRSNSHSALVGFLVPSQLRNFLNASDEVDSALRSVGNHSQVVQSWPYSQPSLSSLQGLAGNSLSALIEGDLTRAYTLAKEATSSLQGWQSGTSQTLWMVAVVVDLVAVSIFLLVGVFRRTKEGTEREYAFNSAKILVLLFVVVLFAGLAGYLQLAGLSSTGHGISSGNASDFTQGLNFIEGGAIFALFGSASTAYMLRSSWDVYKVGLFDVVDPEDNIVGRKPAKAILKKGLLHRAVAVLLFDTQGRLYIQKRGDDTIFYPDHWSVSCIGHVSSGETYSQAAKREVKEQLSLDCELEEISRILSPKWKLNRRYTEWEFITVFKGATKDQKITLSDETVEGKYVTLDEFRTMLVSQRDTITPDSILAFAKYEEVSR